MNEQTETIQAKKGLNTRQKNLLAIVVTVVILLTIVISGLMIKPASFAMNINDKNEAPSLAHLFGTDWIGRDMLNRTLRGLTLSLVVGAVVSLMSAGIALVMSIIASRSKRADIIVTSLIDLFLSVPHLVTLILISIVLGGGLKGVIVGVALTHWPSLTRVLRAEILQIENAEYVSISRRLGKSRLWIARYHYLPHLLPQLLVGAILLFPHAILHEAGVTFLGFGLSPETPAVGIILAEAMRYLSTGYWWLAFFPGLSLLIMVGSFDVLGRSIRKMLDPFQGQRG